MLLAAEALLEQETERGSVDVVWPGGPEANMFTTRPHTTIVHPLPLASESAEAMLEPEGDLHIGAIAFEDAHVALAERIARGDMMRVADRLDDAERLVLLVDELQRLGADPESFAAINALLREHQSRTRLCPAD